MSEINLAKICRNSGSFSQFVDLAEYAQKNPQAYLKNERARQKIVLAAMASPTFTVFSECVKQIKSKEA